MMIFWIALALIAALLAYIRLAPSDPAQWHAMPAFHTDSDLENGANRVVQTGPDGLARLADIARTTPRTQTLAGSVAEGKITWITRTRWIGFPDYTTAVQEGDTLRLHARARFGKSDMGVNRARVDRWIAALGRSAVTSP